METEDGRPKIGDGRPKIGDGETEGLRDGETGEKVGGMTEVGRWEFEYGRGKTDKGGCLPRWKSMRMDFSYFSKRKVKLNKTS